MYDLIIGVFACDKIEKYCQQIRDIQATWANQCAGSVKLLFFLGEEKNAEFTGDSYINLPTVKDDYESASYKQFLGVKYIYETYDVNFVHCCGTDAFVNVPKLVQLLTQYSPAEALYLGGHGDHRQIGHQTYYFHSGGPGFTLSRACLALVHPQLGTMMQEWVTVCQAHRVDQLITACDVAMSYFLQPKNVLVIKNENFTNCDCYGYPCCRGKIFMFNIIACHLMTTQTCQDFYAVLRQNNFFI